MKTLSIFLILFSLSLCSQGQVYNKYSRIECAGNIPSLYLDINDNYVKLQEDNFKDFFSTNKNEEELDKLKEELILASSLSHGFYFQNGLVLFGDPITNFLNSIKLELLKDRPDLKNKINVYVLKSSEANAMTYLDGNIYFTLGLIARVSSEAELAFTLSHEISHYILHHPLEDLKVRTEISELSKNRKKLTLDDLLKLKLSRNRTQEFEADSLGFVLFNKSIYKNEDAVSLLSCLASSHVAIGNVAFDKTYFDADYLKVPACFYKDETSKVRARENISDNLSTHPDIAKRKEKIHSFIKQCKKNTGRSFVRDLKEFEEIKNLASFEILQLLLTNRKFGEAIYNAYFLLKKYPDSEYLQTILAKALFSASIYKNEQVYHYADGSYIHLEGEGQQINYLLKQLSANQLNAIALKVVHRLNKKYPGKPGIDDMETKLIDDLVIKHNLSLEKFLSQKEAEEQFKAKFGIPISDTVSSKITLRNNYKSFFTLALSSEKEDHSIQEKFKIALEKQKILQAEEALSYKEKEILKSRKRASISKSGYQLHADNIIIFEPKYFKFEKDISKSIAHSINDKKELTDGLKTRIKEFNKNITVYSTSELSTGNIKLYNEYCSIANWIGERENHLSKLSIAPLETEQIQRNTNLAKYEYICTLDIVKLPNTDIIYVFNAYNIKTGENIYSNKTEVSNSARLQKLLNIIIKDLNNIIN